jgi:hypothetical protein
MLWRPLNYQRERDREINRVVFLYLRETKSIPCACVWYGWDLSWAPHSHPQFLDNTHSPNLSWTLHFDPPPLVCSYVCVCVCARARSFGFVNWVLRVHNSGLRSLRICELRVACAQFWLALLRVLWVWMEWAMFASRSDECAQAGKRTERRRVYVPCG